MEFNSIRRLLSCARRAVDDYGMIEDGDRIAVGLSGGRTALRSCAYCSTFSAFIRKGLRSAG